MKYDSSNKSDSENHRIFLVILNIALKIKSCKPKKQNIMYNFILIWDITGKLEIQVEQSSCSYYLFLLIYDAIVAH